MDTILEQAGICFQVLNGKGVLYMAFSRILRWISQSSSAHGSLLPELPVQQHTREAFWLRSAGKL